MIEDFNGLVSLCNSSISAFSTGIHVGLNSILFIEESSVIYNRGKNAILGEHPRFIKMVNSSFFKCEGNGLFID